MDERGKDIHINDKNVKKYNGNALEAKGKLLTKQENQSGLFKVTIGNQIVLEQDSIQENSISWMNLTNSRMKTVWTRKVT